MTDFFYHHDVVSFFLDMVSFILPSGYVKIAIENHHRNSGFTQL